MKNTHSILLVLLLLTPGQAHSSGSPKADQCSAQTSISTNERVAWITPDAEQTIRVNKTLYVRPGQGFLGVSFEVEAPNAYGVGWPYTIRFRLEDTCFPGQADWWEVWVKALLYLPNTANRVDVYNKLEVQVRTGGCIRPCIISGNFKSIESLQILGHGPSEWRQDYTEKGSCGNIQPRKEGGYGGYTTPWCQDLPPLRDSTPRADTTTERKPITATPTITPTPTITATPTITPTPTITATPTTTDTPTITPTPTITATPTTTAMPVCIAPP